MKEKIIMLLCAAVTVCACEKKTVFDVSESNLGTSEETRTISDDDIWCEDGCMHFASAEVCMDILNTISSKDVLMEFEAKYNFSSLRSFNELLIDELSECETTEEYESLWETCSDYLKYENDRVMPRVTSSAYAGIANIDGVFYVGNVKHTVVDETIVVENMDNPTRSNSTVVLDYIVPISMTDTRANGGETSQRYTDERYESGKYKVFSRTNLLRHVAVDSKNGVNIYVSSFAVQVHVSGQKKKSLTGWNSYKDRFFVENLHFDVTIANMRIKFLEYRNDYTYSEYGGDVYALQAVGEYAFDGTLVAPMPTGFNCIVHRARSRSMGNCGVVTDKNVCLDYVHLPLPQCIE